MNRSEWDSFRAKVKINDNGCWLWTGQLDTEGYARFQPGKERVYAMKWAYTNLVSAIPVGHQLDHVCHTRAVQEGTCRGGRCQHRRCVNPEHLEPVTPSENTRRQDHANRAKAFCPNGHEYTAENTRIGTDGRRRCRACDKARGK